MDNLLEEAIKLTIEANAGSVSYLQRKLNIGSVRAESLLVEMEKMGIVGKKKGAKPAEFFLDNQRLTEINPNTIIEIPKTAYIKGETTIYGEVIRVGGKEAKVAFKIDNDKTISLDVPRDLAKKVAQSLYSVIGLIGTAKWSRFTHDIEEFKPNDIVPYKGGSIVTSFSLLKNEIGEYWDKIDNISEALLIDDLDEDSLY